MSSAFGILFTIFLPFIAVNTSLFVPVATKPVLSCPLIPLTTVMLLTWKIVFRDKPSCIKAYRRDRNETVEINCIDKRITWASRPDQNPALQIDPVTINHDVYCACALAMPDGSFQHGYHLRVLASPEVTLLPRKNRTAVCKAVAGKPAAQIFWAPEGDCITEYEPQINRTVTVQSTCHWVGNDVSHVTCSVLHLCGNKNITIGLEPLVYSTPWILCTSLSFPLGVLTVVGSITFWKFIGCKYWN